MKSEEIISRILHPLMVLPVFTLIFLSTYMGLADSVYWLSIWILLALIPTATVTWFGGEEKGFDIVSRKERKTAFLTGLASLVLSLVIFNSVSAPEIVLKLGGIGILTVAVFGGANQFNKVSIHTGSMACISIVFLTVSQPVTGILGFLSIAVGWSRVELDRHTRIQVLQGGFLGVICGLVFVVL